MNIFIDFDDTLIDSTRLLRDCLNSFEGVSGESLKETYDRFRAHRTFDLPAFAAEVELMHGIPVQDVLRVMNALGSRTHDYCFDDSKTALQELKDKGHKLILITHATDTAWQWKKIHASGLHDLFDDIHITAQLKSDALQTLADTTPFCFIDDTGETVAQVQARFPNARCFLKLHDNGKGDRFVDRFPCVRSLQELLKLL